MILRDPTPLRFLTLVAYVRVESPPRFDMVEGKKRGTRGSIGWDAPLRKPRGRDILLLVNTRQQGSMRVHYRLVHFN